MASVQYLHGVETVETSTVSGPVETLKSNTIGVVGTAPDADVALFPLNTPVALLSDPTTAAKLGKAGTLLDAVNAIYSQGAATVIVIRVGEGANAGETMAAAVGSPVAKTGVWALLKSRSVNRLVPKLLCAPGLTSNRPTNGIVSATIGAQGTGYVAGSTTVTFAAAPAGGVTAQGTVEVVGGKVTGIVVTQPGVGYTAAPAVTITGAGTGATATSALGSVANPVAKALEAVAYRLRAVAFVDGPNTTPQAAVTYRGDFGSDRVAILDPGVLVFDKDAGVYVTKPASAYAAGLQARIDRELGFWYSFSNNEILNIGGTTRPVDFMYNDFECEANYLNSNQVTTVIHDDGFRFWGLRSTATNPLWAQLSVRRTADMIYEALEKAERSRLDKPFSYALLDAIQSDVNRYLTLMRSRGALINGQCWIDGTLNTAATFSAGQLTVNFDLEPPACLEHLIFQASRNPDYYDAFIEDFARLAAGN